MLTVPLLVTSEMVMEWFSYDISFVGIEWIGPMLGSLVFWWGGWPFLSAAVAEVRERQPGMMLLITLAIAVAYIASHGDEPGLARPRVLVGTRGAGNDHAPRPLAGDEGDRAGTGALAALAELLPDRPSGRRRREIRNVALAELRVGDLVLVRRAHEYRPTARSSRAGPNSMSR